MKIDNKLLLLYFAIGITAAVITGCFLYHNKTKVWNTHARNTFQTVLVNELQKRNINNYYFSSQGHINSINGNEKDKNQEDIPISITSELGKKDFIIPYEKHIHNIEHSSEARCLHSYLLETKPLKSDSLNELWHNLLIKDGYPGKTIVRVSVSDWYEHESNYYSSDSLYLSESDSLTTYYLGYRCEIGVAGYLYCPWWVYFSLTDIFLLCAIAGCCILLFFAQEYLHKLYCHLFVKVKEVPVISVDNNDTHIYQLEDSLFFDADSKILKNDNNSVRLTPMSAKLLTGFLNADNHTLSNTEIMDLLWSDNTGTSDKLHTNIKRLRTFLSQITDWTIENENSAYQLKKPHSID